MYFNANIIWKNGIAYFRSLYDCDLIGETRNNIAAIIIRNNSKCVSFPFYELAFYDISNFINFDFAA